MTIRRKMTVAEIKMTTDEQLNDALDNNMADIDYLEFKYSDEWGQRGRTQQQQRQIDSLWKYRERLYRELYNRHPELDCE